MVSTHVVSALRTGGGGAEGWVLVSVLEDGLGLHLFRREYDPPSHLVDTSSLHVLHAQCTLVTLESCGSCNECLELCQFLCFIT